MRRTIMGNSEQRQTTILPQYFLEQLPCDKHNKRHVMTKYDSVQCD